MIWDDKQLDMVRQSMLFPANIGSGSGIGVVQISLWLCQNSYGLNHHF